MEFASDHPDVHPSSPPSPSPTTKGMQKNRLPFSPNKDRNLEKEHIWNWSPSTAPMAFHWNDGCKKEIQTEIIRNVMFLKYSAECVSVCVKL